MIRGIPGRRAVAASAMSSAMLLPLTASADGPPAPAASAPAPVVVAPAQATGSTEANDSAPAPTPMSTLDLPVTETSSPINRPLMTTSLIVLGGSYGASAIVAYASSRPEDQKNLYYPVAGPWMDLANRDCNSRPCNNETLNKVLLIADGAGQGLAALGVLSSFFLPEKSTRHWYLLGNNDVHWAPSSVGSGYGLAAAGRF